MLYIGIDLGTSSVKLLLINELGEIKKTAIREYPIYYPEAGWSEQNPEDWYEKTVDGLKELLVGCDITQIDGLSFAGQMHGLVILDENDRVIRPCILWNDGRTKTECEYLNSIIGREKISKYTANIAFAGFTAPKILWIREHEPENFARIKKIMLPKDYLAYKMTGVFSSDVSDASGTLLFDVEHRCWSKEMCDICGIYESMLPKVYESYESIGVLSENLKNQLGIKREVKVAAGAGDNAAAAISTGTIGEGKCNLSLGTSGTIFISSETFSVDKNNALHSFCNSDGRYHLMGCILSAAFCNKWWMEDILETSAYENEQEKIKKLGHNNVYFLPYLMGERSPHNNPNARGTFIGMSADTTREDMTLSVLEGVAYAFRDSLEIGRKSGIVVSRTKICGGGAKSELWIKILANVLDVHVDILEKEEGPSFGAAMLAAVAAGCYKDVAEACEKLIHVVKTISPDKELVDKYEQGYRKYVQIYPACKGIYDVIVNV